MIWFALKLALKGVVFVIVAVLIMAGALMLLGLGLEMMRKKRGSSVLPWPKLPRID